MATAVSGAVRTRGQRIALLVGTAALAIACVMTTIPIKVSIGRARSVECGSAFRVWSRPDARALLVGVNRLLVGEDQPPLTRTQRQFYAHLVDDAAAWPRCRNAAALRFGVAGLLSFTAVVCVLVELLFVAGLRRGGSGSALRFEVALALIAFVAFSVRVALVLARSRYVPLGFDSRHFNVGWRAFERPSALFPPAFNALLGAASWIGLRSRLWHHFVTAAIGTTTVVLLAFVGRRFGGQSLALLVAALAALYPMLFGADATLMSETLYLAMVVTTLLLALRARDRPTVPRFALLGLGVALAAATRGEGLLLVPLLALPLVVAMRDERLARRLALVATTVLVVVVVLTPWLIRNYLVFDEPVLMSNNSATVVAGANCARTYSGELRGSWDVECLVGRYTTAERSGTAFNEAAANRRARDAGLRYARAHLGELPALAAVRVLRTWGIYAPVGQMNLETRIEQRVYFWQFVGWLELLALLPLSVLGARQVRRRGVAVWPLLSLAILVTVTSALTYGNGRFRMAAEPAVLVLGAAGILALRDRLRRRTQ